MLNALALDILEPEAELTIHHPHAPLLTENELNILLVEDSQSDAALTKIALDAANIPYNLSKIKHGDDVLSRLTVSQAVRPSNLPDLMMLDLGLPVMDGFEVLAEMALLPASVRQIPIVILTGHKHFEYLRYTYPYLHIIGYVNKPCHVQDIKPLIIQARHERDRHIIH